MKLSEQLHAAATLDLRDVARRLRIAEAELERARSQLSNALASERSAENKALLLESGIRAVERAMLQLGAITIEERSPEA